MSILVVAEHYEGKLRNTTLPVIGFAKAAAKIEDLEIIGLVLGHNNLEVAEDFARYGFDRVIYVDDEMFENYLAEAYTPAIAEIAESIEAEIIAVSSTTFGRDLAPRVTANLDVGMISDVIEVYNDEEEGQLCYKRPIWAGNLIERTTCDADQTVVTVRTTAYEPPKPGSACDVEEIDASTDAPENVEFVAYNAVKSDRPDLTDADVIVAGGRGLKSVEGFNMLETLADHLGAAIGASRAAVDSGFVPNDLQVGQTGKIVAPNLYIAVAISGAIQHLAGMKGSKVIVAVNNNPEAPIFQVADYGLVSDAFKAIPKLNEQLANR